MLRPPLRWIPRTVVRVPRACAHWRVQTRGFRRPWRLAPRKSSGCRRWFCWNVRDGGDDACGGGEGRAFSRARGWSGRGRLRPSEIEAGDRASFRVRRLRRHRRRPAVDAAAAVRGAGAHRCRVAGRRASGSACRAASKCIDLCMISAPASRAPNTLERRGAASNCSTMSSSAPD